MTDGETDTLIGQTAADHYEVLSCLDAAGNARIYKVKDSRDSVIKVMKLLPNFKEDKLDSFMAEAEKVKNLIKHPAMAQLYEVGVVREAAGIGSYVFMISDFLPGRSLFSVLNRQGRIELTESLPIFIQLDVLQIFNQLIKGLLPLVRIFSQ